MTWTMIDVLVGARCGTLAYVCCNTPQQVVEMVRGLENKPDHEIIKIVQVICNLCGTNGNGQNPPPADPAALAAEADACRKKFVASACSQNIQTTLALVDEAIGILLLAGVAAKKLPAPVAKALFALSAALNAWRIACETQDITAGVLKAICAAYSTAKNAFSMLPGDLDASIATALERFFALEDITAAINTCCGSPALAAAPAATWAEDPEAYRQEVVSNPSTRQPTWWKDLPPLTILT